MSLCILSAAPESSSSGFATSLAIILGVLARRPTLLVDFNKPHLTRKALGINDARGTEALYSDSKQKRHVNCWCDKISAGKKQKQLEFRTPGLEILSHPTPRCQLCQYSDTIRQGK